MTHFFSVVFIPPHKAKRAVWRLARWTGGDRAETLDWLRHSLVDRCLKVRRHQLLIWWCYLIRINSSSCCMHLNPRPSDPYVFSYLRFSCERDSQIPNLCNKPVILDWEWRPESSSSPSGFLNRSYEIRSLCFQFFPFFVLEFDLNFPEFGSIPGNDFWGIGSC